MKVGTKESRRKALVISRLVATITLTQTWNGWADSGWLASQMAQSDSQRTQMDQLSPEEREQVRKNYLRFKKLPPQERERIRKNFHEWQQLSPEEKQKLRERYKQMNR